MRAAATAAALSVFAGLADAASVNAALLSREPVRGVSTFLGYYLLRARGDAGDIGGALDLVRTYWGAMLDLGATTFWEDFDLAWAKGRSPSTCFPKGARTTSTETTEITATAGSVIPCATAGRPGPCPS